MQTRAEIETELIARLMVANNSTQFSSSRITTLVQDASLWAGTLYFWPSLYRSRYFSTKPSIESNTPILPLNYDYYDYPTDMLTGSISRLYISGLKYEKKAFQDFLDYVDEASNNSLPPDPSKRIFAEYGRQFFVYPGVATAGTNDGLIWGNVQPPPLSSSSTNTIFSLWDDAGNEAICKKALSVAMERLDSGFALEQKQEAIQLLTVIWKKVVTQNQRSQRLQHPHFNVPDLIGSGNTVIANFNGVDIIS